MGGHNIFDMHDREFKVHITTPIPDGAPDDGCEIVVRDMSEIVIADEINDKAAACAQGNADILPRGNTSAAEVLLDVCARIESLHRRISDAADVNPSARNAGALRIVGDELDAIMRDTRRKIAAFTDTVNRRG